MKAVMTEFSNVFLWGVTQWGVRLVFMIFVVNLLFKILVSLFGMKSTRVNQIFNVGMFISGAVIVIVFGASFFIEAGDYLLNLVTDK